MFSNPSIERSDVLSRFIDTLTGQTSIRKSMERATRRRSWRTTARAGMVHVTGRFSSPFPVHWFAQGRLFRKVEPFPSDTSSWKGGSRCQLRFVRFTRSRSPPLCWMAIPSCSSNVRLDRAAGSMNPLGSDRYTKNDFET